MNPVLVDTGFLVAVYDRHESHHALCLRIYESLSNPLVTCEAVVTEALHLLHHAPGAAQGILASIDQGSLEVPFALSQRVASVQAILARYADTPADFADACLIQMADDLDTGDILTLDSNFKHYRWRRNRSFRLLIPLE